MSVASCLSGEPHWASAGMDTASINAAVTRIPENFISALFVGFTHRLEILLPQIHLRLVLDRCRAAVSFRNLSNYSPKELSLNTVI